MAPGFPGRVEVSEECDTCQQGNDPGDPRWARPDPSRHSERRNLYPAQRETCGDDGGDGDSDHHDEDVDGVKGEVTLRQRGPGERHVVEQRSDCEEESETEDDSGEGGDDRFDGRNRRDLARSGADQPHRGEALFAPDG